MPGFFNADVFDAADFGVVDLFASEDFVPLPVAVELRCFSADVVLAAEFVLFPLDNAELPRAEPVADELNRLVVEPLP